jgi:hypothetical protein
MKKSFLSSLLLLGLLVAPSVSIAAGPSGFTQEQKIFANDGMSNDNFDAVAMSGDGTRMIVGAPGDESFQGSAYVFVRSGTIWAQEQKLTVTGLPNDMFGYAVAMNSDGSRVVVGAHRENGDMGAAYVFSRSGTLWTLEQRLTADDGTINNLFSYTVSLSADGTRVVVGSIGNDSGSGAAYVFVRSGITWTQEQKITASDRAVSDGFGQVGISADGTRIVSGAPGDDSNKGSAYVFTRSGSVWTEEQKLTATDGAAGDQFGISTALSSDGSRAVIGAYFDGDLGSNSGSAYVFSRTGTVWSQEAKLHASNGAAGNQFGGSVAITGAGDRVVVGTTFATGAYTFLKSKKGWSQSQLLVPNDFPGSGDGFGVSVAISADGTRILGGARDGGNQGAAYVFHAGH